MGIIAKDDNQVNLYYNSNSINDKEANSYLKAFDEDLLAIDTANEMLPESHWAELIEGVDKPIKEIVDLDMLESDQVEQINASDFSIEDWLTIIKNKPELIQGVIAIINGKFKHFNSPKSLISFVADNSSSNNDSRT
ncbi:hypothetical protein HME9304_00198 [Flagellimonas maritima]|uniref:Uncharacterized protein n=1 Tax=Flagellimonas maritima TaxID=1383885 RepID=A0A2Z4LN02_9FLAO|nr:hypothetical protein [Allomuricauda aurantiaca]AWX43211.1 hypothetical protein HME9304_00198 [Allomuricauda aurantiaca]